MSDINNAAKCNGASGKQIVRDLNVHPHPQSRASNNIQLVLPAVKKTVPQNAVGSSVSCRLIALCHLVLLLFVGWPCISFPSCPWFHAIP